MKNLLLLSCRQFKSSEREFSFASSLSCLCESQESSRCIRLFLEAIRSQAIDRLFLALRNHDRITFKLDIVHNTEYDNHVRH
jgi:hypothetical protein